MHSKTRGNYPVTKCIKFECKLRNECCKVCRGSDHYLKRFITNEKNKCKKCGITCKEDLCINCVPHDNLLGLEIVHYNQ